MSYDYALVVDRQLKVKVDVGNTLLILSKDVVDIYLGNDGLILFLSGTKTFQTLAAT